MFESFIRAHLVLVSGQFRKVIIRYNAAALGWFNIFQIGQYC